MLKTLLLFFPFAIALLSAHAQQAQKSKPQLCEAHRREDARRFEEWLAAKQIASVTNTTQIYRVPVVVHLLNLGEPIGEGYNYSEERVKAQIRALNEDYRRIKGTPGYNTHPDGGDARIEFVLAEVDPEGNATNGIVRVDMNSVEAPDTVADFIFICSQYSYWDPDHYINVWSVPGLPPGLLLGSARFPVTDLDGIPDQGTRAEDGDGIFINALNFGWGDTNTDPYYNMGRTLTHEMGHFLGVLHTFGTLANVNHCDEYTDYCNDTPPSYKGTDGCPDTKPVACDGSRVMIENYMDYSYDQCMNIFTNDQIARMHVVLENSPRRKSLLTSPALKPRDNLIIKIYPNPVTDKLFISADEISWGHAVQVTAHTLLGKPLFEKTFELTGNEIELSLKDLHEKVIIITVKGAGMLHKELIMVP